MWITACLSRSRFAVERCVDCKDRHSQSGESIKKRSEKSKVPSQVRRTLAVRERATWLTYLGIFVPTVILKLGDGMVYDRYTINEYVMVLIGCAIFTVLFGVAPNLVLEGALASGRSTAVAAWVTGLVAGASVCVIYIVVVLAFGTDNAIHFPVLVQVSFVVMVVLSVAGGISHALRKPQQLRE
jgi:uncharacterized protein YacL